MKTRKETAYYQLGQDNMKLLRFVTQINLLKTVYVNLKLFPLKMAIRLPIIIGNHVKVDIHGKVLIEDPNPVFGMISFGIGGSNDLRFFNSRNSYWGIKSGGKIVFKGKAHFSVHSSILVSGATMIVGKNISCNNGTKISCIEGLEIGEECLIGTNVLIMDSDGHTIYEKSKAHPNKRKITIGNHVWLTSGVSVLKGVNIANDAVVAYGSVVTKDLKEPSAIYAGTPAKLVRQGVSWEK